MCSIQEDEILTPLKRPAPLSARSRQCMKCKENAAVVVIRTDDPLCRDCFMSYCVHKFRMTFGKSRVIEDKEHVLIGYSGGAGSAALTHLVLEGKGEKAKRPLRFTPTLVHIKEGEYAGQNADEETKLTKQIKHAMEQTGFNYAVYDLAQVFDDGNLQPMDTNIDELAARLSTLSTEPTTRNQSKLHQLFKSAKSVTAKQQLLANLRTQFFQRLAQVHGVKKVLLGDNATQLAVRMLGNITQGGGAHLSYEMGFIDDRSADTMFLRPIKGFTSKEVALYNSLNGVQTVFIPNLSTKANSSSSLQRLTEHFITGLQADFPNTVYTVCRTGEKLDMSKNSDIERCCMCQVPLDTDVGESSALSATVFSQKLCRSKSATQSTANNATSGAQATTNEEAGNCACDNEATNQKAGDSAECCGEGDGSCNSSKRLSRDDLSAAMCYSCRLTLKDLEDFETLPDYILQEAGTRSRRTQMKAEIADFLLEGEDDDR